MAFWLFSLRTLTKYDCSRQACSTLKHHIHNSKVFTTLFHISPPLSGTKKSLEDFYAVNSGIWIHGWFFLVSFSWQKNYIIAQSTAGSPKGRGKPCHLLIFSSLLSNVSFGKRKSRGILIECYMKNSGPLFKDRSVLRLLLSRIGKIIIKMLKGILEAG